MEPLTLTRREARFARRRRPSSLTVPKNVSPHVKLVFEEMRRQQITYDRAEEMSGVLRATIKTWRHKNKPGLESIEAVLGCLGWDFVPIPRARVLPSGLVADLRAVADMHKMPVEKAVETLIALVANVHERFPFCEVPPPPPPIRLKQRKKRRAAPTTAPTGDEIAEPL